MKIIILLLLFCVTALAGPVYEFNPTSAWVTNRGVRLYWPWERTGVESSNIIGNALEYPAGVPIEFTMNSNGIIVALSSVESNSVVTLTASNLNFNVTNGIALRAEFERTNAPSVFGFTDERNRIIKAVVFIVLNELNILRTNHLSATNFPARTTNQVINAVSNALVNATL